MSELDTLIAEQERDMRFGDRNQKQDSSLEELERFLAEDGFTGRLPDRGGECHLHGRANVTTSNNWVGWRCRICYAERTKAYMAAHPEKQREYVKRYRATEKGRANHRKHNRAWYERNKDRINARRRERARAAREAALNVAGSGDGSSREGNPGLQTQAEAAGTEPSTFAANSRTVP